jgi:hypothetical protein
LVVPSSGTQLFASTSISSVRRHSKADYLRLGNGRASPTPPNRNRTYLASFVGRTDNSDKAQISEPPHKFSREPNGLTPKSHKPEYSRAAEQGIRWLERAEPASTEDHVFQILGLIWGGGSRETIRKAALHLVELQRSDGGWGQIPPLASDALRNGPGASGVKSTGTTALEI